MSLLCTEPGPPESHRQDHEGQRGPLPLSPEQGVLGCSWPGETLWFPIDQRSHVPGTGSHSRRVPSGRGGRFSPAISCTRSLSSSVYCPATRLFCLHDNQLLLTLGHSWATQQRPPTILSEVLRPPALSIETEPIGCVCVWVCVENGGVRRGGERGRSGGMGFKELVHTIIGADESKI